MTSHVRSALWTLQCNLYVNLISKDRFYSDHSRILKVFCQSFNSTSKFLVLPKHILSATSISQIPIFDLCLLLGVQSPCMLPLIERYVEGRSFVVALYVVQAMYEYTVESTYVGYSSYY